MEFRPVFDGRTRRGRSSILERFVGKYVVNETNGCFEWIAALNDKGYGVFNDYTNGRNSQGHSAYRWALKNIAGVDIPPAMQADHLCNNRRCVNVVAPRAEFTTLYPDTLIYGHFRIATPRENVLALHSDTFVRIQLERTHCVEGHELTGLNLRMEGVHRRCRLCAKKKRWLAHAKLKGITGPWVERPLRPPRVHRK